MIRINQLKCKIEYRPEDLLQAITSKLKVQEKQIRNVNIVKRSIDARDKGDIHYSLSVDVDVENEEKVLKRLGKNKDIQMSQTKPYIYPEQGKELLPGRPVIAGSGPAGLFCAYMLAINGYRPILIERGQDVDTRTKSVEDFHAGKAELNPESNVQFGEGGAGTFSDGKLNCSIKDKTGRARVVLETFVRHGAKEEILFDNKPHVGTDKLVNIVKNMREEILAHGGQVRFDTKLDDIIIKDDHISSVKLIENGCREYEEDCSILVLATGHSSRDTFHMLNEAGLDMEAKPFAIGVRAEHNQERINQAQYGREYKVKYPKLPAADYKLTYHTSKGKSVYSFCMCPGGYVTDSSSEPGHLCVNGMSYSARDGINSNAAIVVNITPEDTGASEGDIFKGIEFQRSLEKAAFEAGSGKIPVQRLEDFINNKKTEAFGSVTPQHEGQDTYADINGILPEFMCESIKEAFEDFGRRINGFNDPDTILSAVESRTSSPIRIKRNEQLQSNFKGIYPCGEGAGYAGGIMSAAMDGIKIFEEIYKTWVPEKN